MALVRIDASTLSAVKGPVLVNGQFWKFALGTIAVLPPGGLRGDISGALAPLLQEVAGKAKQIAADSSGYVRNIGVDVLMHLAAEHFLSCASKCPRAGSP